MSLIKVREYLKNIYINAVKEWNIDGLKLDFIDEFYLRPVVVLDKDVQAIGLGTNNENDYYMIVS